MFWVFVLFLIEISSFLFVTYFENRWIYGRMVCHSECASLNSMWRDGDFARFGLSSVMSNVSVWIKYNINRRRRRWRCRRFGSPYRSSLIVLLSLAHALFFWSLVLYFEKCMNSCMNLLQRYVCVPARIVIPFVNQKMLCCIQIVRNEWFGFWFRVSDLSLSSTVRFSPFDVCHVRVRRRDRIYEFYTRIRWTTTVHTTTTKTATTFICMYLCAVTIMCMLLLRTHFTRHSIFVRYCFILSLRIFHNFQFFTLFLSLSFLVRKQSMPFTIVTMHGNKHVSMKRLNRICPIFNRQPP